MIPLEPLSLVQQPKQMPHFPKISSKVDDFLEKLDFLKNGPKIEKTQFENSDFSRFFFAKFFENPQINLFIFAIFSGNPQINSRWSIF